MLLGTDRAEGRLVNGMRNLDRWRLESKLMEVMTGETRGHNRENHFKRDITFNIMIAHQKGTGSDLYSNTKMEPIAMVFQFCTHFKNLFYYVVLRSSANISLTVQHFQEYSI